MVSEAVKLFKACKVCKGKKSNIALKIALGFRFAQTLLNLAIARFLGQFLADLGITRLKSNNAFASLMLF